MIIIALHSGGCAPAQQKITKREAHHHLETFRNQIADGFIETVVSQNREIIAKNDKDPPADVALYLLVETYAYHNYDGRDLGISQSYFERLINNFPNSPLTSEAKVYVCPRRQTRARL